MPKVKQRVEDVVWDKTEIVNTPSGPVMLVYFVRQVTEDGVVVEQRPRERVIVRPGEHLTDAETAELARMLGKAFDGVRDATVGS